MKKYLVLLVLLALSLTAVAAQELDLFADVDAVELSAVEMKMVAGGGHVRELPGDCVPGGSGKPIANKPARVIKSVETVEKDITIKVRIPPYTKYPLVEFEFSIKKRK